MTRWLNFLRHPRSPLEQSRRGLAGEPGRSGPIGAGPIACRVPLEEAHRVPEGIQDLS
jgi:hypothetical protein